MAKSFTGGGETGITAVIKSSKMMNDQLIFPNPSPNPISNPSPNSNLGPNPPPSPLTRTPNQSPPLHPPTFSPLSLVVETSGATEFALISPNMSWSRLSKRTHHLSYLFRNLHHAQFESRGLHDALGRTHSFSKTNSIRYGQGFGSAFRGLTWRCEFSTGLFDKCVMRQFLYIGDFAKLPDMGVLFSVVRVLKKRLLDMLKMEQSPPGRSWCSSMLMWLMECLGNFLPTQREVRVKPGESALAFYTAENRSSTPITGVSTYNVTPMKAAVYFNKIQCFCFEEQRLLPGEQIDMPVFFYIDPEFETDPRMDGINNLILSYTFFKVSEE
ncbi:hypothetical protein F0562_005366 [Nyssa sinensis]|uniref:Uncharacterized protein n=1 Tax=Nyssa sinensis TaxID=561372 RepID=A0A5J5AJ87_9ASTE|nr:hypothetical protein F0562_005366 [Nyssa sinensis]